MLEEARDRYADLYDFAPVGLVALDSAGIVREVNLKGLAMLGLDEGRALGQPFTRFVADRRAFHRSMAACRRTGKVQINEMELTPDEGAGHIVDLVVQRAAGASSGFRLALVDVTERKKVEAERGRLLVAEREARESNEAKDSFIAALSHELRTPLTPVLAAVSALRGGRVPKAAMTRLCRIIERNVALEARLIDDLLDATRLRYGKVQLERQPLSLHAVVSDVVGMLRSEAREKRLALMVELAARKDVVDGDPIRLRQMLWNLLKNAIKFTAERGEVMIRSWDSGGRLALEVSDTGIGLAPEAIVRIFQPFEQVATGGSGGLGLGLAIAQGIAQLHGGTISASSPGLGRGTRFAVSFPTMAAGAPHRPTLSPGPTLESRPLTRRNLLLVEDNVDTAEALSLALSSAGYQVTTAATMEEALRADFSSVSLMISDIGFPGGGGLALMRRLRGKMSVRAIALSGYGTERDIRASHEAGFLAHLTKPIDLSELLAAIERALGEGDPGYPVDVARPRRRAVVRNSVAMLSLMTPSPRPRTEKRGS